MLVMGPQAAEAPLMVQGDLKWVTEASCGVSGCVSRNSLSWECLRIWFPTGGYRTKPHLPACGPDFLRLHLFTQPCGKSMSCLLTEAAGGCTSRTWLEGASVGGGGALLEGTGRGGDSTWL